MSKTTFFGFPLAVLIFMAFMFLIVISSIVGIGYIVITEINDSGGVGKCLGEVAHDFDSARRGE